MKTIKIDPAKALKIAGMVLAVAGTVVSNIVTENDKKAAKLELKDELLKELKSDKN